MSYMADEIVGRGFRISLRDRAITIGATRTPEEHLQLMADLANSRDETRDLIRAKSHELEEELARYPTFDILAQISFAELHINPETYKEWAHDGLQLNVEYLTMLALKGPFREDGDQLIDGPKIEKIRDLLKEIERLTFWCYLSEVDVPPGVSRIHLQSYTTAFDDYYMFLSGERRKPAPRPRQPMPEVMRRLLDEMDQLHPPGYLVASLFLLDNASDARNQVAGVMHKLQGLVRKDGMVHDFSVFRETPVREGFTVMVGDVRSRKHLEQRLAAYAKLKKYEFQAERWSGLGLVVGADRKLQVATYCALIKPWMHDPDIERPLAAFKQSLSFQRRSG